MLHNSVEQICLQSLAHGVMEPSFLAQQSLGALMLCPMEFGSNATFAPQTHGDIVSGAKITTKTIYKINIIFILNVIFLGHCHLRDIQNQHDRFLRKKYLKKYLSAYSLTLFSSGTYLPASKVSLQRRVFTFKNTTEQSYVQEITARKNCNFQPLQPCNAVFLIFSEDYWQFVVPR